MTKEPGSIASSDSKAAQRPAFGLIGLVTDDMAASLAFYRRLGVELPAAADGEPHVEAVLPGGGTRVAWDTVETVRSFDPQWTRPSGGHRVALAFGYDSPGAVDAAYAGLTGAGYRGHREPWDAFWGQRYAIVLDSDGVVVELYAASEPAG